jgi:hypothetical protein
MTGLDILIFQDSFEFVFNDLAAFSGIVRSKWRKDSFYAVVLNADQSVSVRASDGQTFILSITGAPTGSMPVRFVGEQRPTTGAELYAMVSHNLS